MTSIEAGNYKVKLTVLNELGVPSSSTDESIVSFTAIPDHRLHIRLGWDNPLGDLDLHLVKAELVDGVYRSRIFHSTLDCSYLNCKPNCPNCISQAHWFESHEPNIGPNPSLDIDDTEGFGPENINIDEAVSGSYLVGIHHFSAPSQSGGIGNTVRIYLYGQLHAEFYNILDEDENYEGDFWEVAIIHWPSPEEGVPCIEDLSTSDLECPEN